MRRSLLVILMLLLACSFANAADYIRIDVDSIVANSTVDMEFYITRECPTPAMITGTSNGFVMNTMGTATWAYNSFTADPTAAAWFNLGGLLYTDGLTGTTTSGQFLTGGAAMPPAGLPIVTEQLYFTLNFDVMADAGDDAAYVCIDSQFVFSAGAWKFSGMTCGDEPSPNENRPKFLAYDFSDAVHPICMKVYELQCGAPTINVTPIGNQLVGNHCAGLAFDFGADPGTFGLDPATIVGWAVTSGLGVIDGSGGYTVGANPTGTYPVTIEVENDCGLTDDYSFNLVYTNQDPTISNCVGMASAISSGNTYSFDFNASDPNLCDGLSWSVVGGDRKSVV